MGYAETSVRNYNYSLRNNQEERSFRGSPRSHSAENSIGRDCGPVVGQTNGGRR